MNHDRGRASAHTIATPRAYLFQESQAYAKARRQMAAPSSHLRERDEPVYSELELQSLWFAGAFGRRFTTLTGEPLEVIQFGHWNHGSGPDFSDAAISIGGQRRRGAIELDPEARDWERHGHGENAEYEQVILHVFFASGPDRFFTRTRTHREVPQVRLSIEDLDHQAAYLPADAHLGRCSFDFKATDDGDVDQILCAAAQFRLEQKAQWMGHTRDVHGEEQALFQGMAECLGYQHNAFPLRVLSQRATLSDLRSLPSALEIDARLFGMAGFLEGRFHVDSPDDRTTDYQRSLWSHWWLQREEAPSSRKLPLPWRTAGIRPQNHPQRRLGALTHLVAAWKPFHRLATADTFDPKGLEQFLAKLSHPFWDHHYTLRARSKQGLALIGTSRARDAIINQILPLRLRRKPQMTWEHYRRLPALQSNAKIRRAAIRLFGEHPRQARFLKKAYQQQALLQIYDDFCLPDDSGCQDCPFPEQLRRMLTTLKKAKSR